MNNLSLNPDFQISWATPGVMFIFLNRNISICQTHIYISVFFSAGSGYWEAGCVPIVPLPPSSAGTSKGLSSNTQEFTSQYTQLASQVMLKPVGLTFLSEDGASASLMMDGPSEAGNADLLWWICFSCWTESLQCCHGIMGSPFFVPAKGVQCSHVNPLCNLLYPSSGGVEVGELSARIPQNNCLLLAQLPCPFPLNKRV